MKRVKNFDNFELLEFKILRKYDDQYWEAEQIDEEIEDTDLFIHRDWFYNEIVIDPETNITVQEIKEFIAKEISNPTLISFSNTF